MLTVSQKNPALSEIYVVEGDSAGGSAKQGRDRKYQAILPLKGKILNVEKATAAKMLENMEIKTIIAALGVGIGQENFNIEKLRYHKIIIMTDADVDGSHIRTLILTFFFRHMKPLIERGFVYLAQPPLFLVKKGKSKIYIKNEKELENYLLKKISEEVVIHYEDDGEEKSLKEKQLRKFIKLINKKTQIINDLEKRGMPRNLINLLIDLIRDEASLKDKDLTEKILEQLKKEDNCKKVEMRYDEEYSIYTIDIGYELNGVTMNKTIDWNYLIGPEFSEVNLTFEKLKEYPLPPYNVKIGNDESVIEDKDELVEHLFERIKKGLYIQRYKGLGEMNPGQLWETTMDPEARTLLKVDINDIVESETVFDTLMGSDSIKRREFILENALNVKNLDV